MPASAPHWSEENKKTAALGMLQACACSCTCQHAQNSPFPQNSEYAQNSVNMPEFDTSRLLLMLRTLLPAHCPRCRPAYAPVPTDAQNRLSVDAPLVCTAPAAGLRVLLRLPLWPWAVPVRGPPELRELLHKL